ncbi:hypothetical protein [Pseudomonas syringae]|uniref:hypothetical protein n=1 Tax=Pseudomonas syringae TaxID=317 RepID=UPI00070B0208|nr:hypothetical protein [Pseudomonas syringae]
MGLISRWFSRRIVSTQKKEIQAFIDGLSSMDSQEIGFLLAAATHQRNMLEEEGFRLMDPLVDYPSNPTIVIRLRGFIRAYQKASQPTDAAGTMVWLHTMRVGGQHELRSLARNMWRELARGMPHVEYAATQIYLITRNYPITAGYEDFPKGLTPAPC